MLYDTCEKIEIHAELDVKISVSPYINCCIDRISSYDDRQEFINVYIINKLDLYDRRLIRVNMSSEFYKCKDIGDSGIPITTLNGIQRVLSGERCNYIPYQLVKDCRDGDTFDYTIILPFRIFIKLHVTCQQDVHKYFDYIDANVYNNFKKFDDAIFNCIGNKLAI